VESKSNNGEIPALEAGVLLMLARFISDVLRKGLSAVDPRLDRERRRSAGSSCLFAMFVCECSQSIL